MLSLKKVKHLKNNYDKKYIVLYSTENCINTIFSKKFINFEIINVV